MARLVGRLNEQVRTWLIRSENLSSVLNSRFNCSIWLLANGEILYCRWVFPIFWNTQKSSDRTFKSEPQRLDAQCWGITASGTWNWILEGPLVTISKFPVLPVFLVTSCPRTKWLLLLGQAEVSSRRTLCCSRNRHEACLWMYLNSKSVSSSRWRDRIIQQFGFRSY